MLHHDLQSVGPPYLDQDLVAILLPIGQMVRLDRHFNPRIMIHVK